jgi:hypothetical protein
MFGHVFDMSPITPNLVRKVFGLKKATSAQGPSELMYGAEAEAEAEAAFFFGHSLFSVAPGGS